MSSSTKSQAVFGLAFFLFAEIVSAGSFNVRPTRLELSAQTSAGVLTVHNASDEDAVIQVQANRWTQPDGADVLEPSGDLIAVPPLFTLAPGGSQVVRIGLRRAPAPDEELTYRILLREVPPPPAEDFTGLQVALTLSLPVFVTPPGGAKPELRWNLEPVDDGLALQVSNDGNAHVQLKKLTLAPAQGDAIEGGNVPVYLLPRQSRAWPIAADTTVGAEWKLVADTDAGPVEAKLVVGRAH